MNEEMRAAFEKWHENRRNEILQVAEEIRLQMIAEGYSDSSVTAAEATYTAIERVTKNNDSFVIYQAAWQHSEAKALEQIALQQAKIDSLQQEIERLRQPVSDEQIEKILDVNMQWVAFRPKFTIERRNSEMRSILERK